MRNLALALIGVALPLSAPSAEVLTVGPLGSGAQFLEIQLAIDAASPDDVVQVAAGTYKPFVVDKPIRVQGAGPESTVIAIGPGFSLATIAIIEGLNQGEVAVVSGMSTVIDGILLNGEGMVLVRPGDGTVALHDLDLHTIAGEPCVLADDVGRVIVSSSVLLGGGGNDIGKGPTLDLDDSRAWVVDSTITAPDLFSFFIGPPHLTVNLERSEAYFAGSIVHGPSASSTYFVDGGDGIRAEESTFSLDRCVVTGGNCTTASGGFALQLFSNTIGTAHADTVVLAGAGGGGVPLTVDATSQAVADPLVAPTLRASVPRATAGDVIEFDLYGSPFAAAALFGSPNLGSGAAVPGVVGEVFVDLTAPLLLATIALDVNGEGSVALAVPTVAEPSLAAFQWVDIASPLRASNPAFVSLQ